MLMLIVRGISDDETLKFSDKSRDGGCLFNYKAQWKLMAHTF